MITNKKTVHIFIPLLIVLFIMAFYRPVFYVDILSGLKLLAFSILVNMIFIRKIYSLSAMPFKKLFILYFLFIVLNIISCWIFREQSFWVSIKCYAPFFLVYLTPAFYSMNLTTEKWEKVLSYLWLIYIICNYLQYIFIDIQLFNLMKEFFRMKEEMRAVVFGEAILYLGGLMCLNRFLLHKKKIYMIGYLLTCVLIFLHGFRMSILGFSIVSILLITKIVGLRRTILISSIVAIFSFTFIIQIPIVQDKISEITERNQNDNLNNEDYARLKTWNYFNNNHFKNPIERVLGSGQTLVFAREAIKTKTPNYESKYSKDRCELVYYNYTWSVDWGLIGLSWDSGILFTLCLIVLLYLIYKEKLRNELLYIKYWALYLLIIGVTQATSYSQNIFVFYAIILTIIQTERKFFIKR